MSVGNTLGALGVLVGVTLGGAGDSVVVGKSRVGVALGGIGVMLGAGTVAVGVALGRSETTGIDFVGEASATPSSVPQATRLAANTNAGTRTQSMLFRT